MRQRYEVCENGRWFASVHAATEDEAILIACRKVDGRDPSTCKSVLAGARTATAKVATWTTCASRRIA